MFCTSIYIAQLTRYRQAKTDNARAVIRAKKDIELETKKNAAQKKMFVADSLAQEHATTRQEYFNFRAQQEGVILDDVTAGKVLPQDQNYNMQQMANWGADYTNIVTNVKETGEELYDESGNSVIEGAKDLEVELETKGSFIDDMIAFFEPLVKWAKEQFQKGIELLTGGGH